MYLLNISSISAYRLRRWPNILLTSRKHLPLANKKLISAGKLWKQRSPHLESVNKWWRPRARRRAPDDIKGHDGKKKQTPDQRAQNGDLTFIQNRAARASIWSALVALPMAWRCSASDWWANTGVHNAGLPPLSSGAACSQINAAIFFSADTIERILFCYLQGRFKLRLSGDECASCVNSLRNKTV